MIILMFVTALILSGIAAWYAIVGLMAIFAAAPIQIAIMGGALEVSKLVVASWLYRNWKPIPKLLRAYFCIALIVLMLLTSLGIFGFLSKAHLDQTVPSGNVIANISILDEKIEIEKEKIDEYRKIMAQLDEQVNQTITRTAEQGNDRGVRRSINIRKSQSTERNSVRSEIEASQKEILQLTEEKAILSRDLRAVEAEVGPIRYIAALIYGDNPDSNLLEKAVRIVILMIVFVFDPLAVLMLIAANWSLMHRKPNDEIQTNTTEEKLREFATNLANNQQPFDENFQKVLRDNLWNLYDVDEPKVVPEVKKNEPVIDIPQTPEPQIDYDSHGRRITPLK